MYAKPCGAPAFHRKGKPQELSGTDRCPGPGHQTSIAGSGESRRFVPARPQADEWRTRVFSKSVCRLRSRGTTLHEKRLPRQDQTHRTKRTFNILLSNMPGLLNELTIRATNVILRGDDFPIWNGPKTPIGGLPRSIFLCFLRSC